MNVFCIRALSVRNLRNVRRADLTPSAGLNVLSGDNGQGKTSILEAIYLACTTRSFRTSKLGDLVSYGEPVGSVRARVIDGAGEREQSVGLEGARRRVTSAGKAPKSLASYAVRSPIVAFHPGEMVLSSGPASSRRTLLDRIALFVDPRSGDHHQRYAKALRARQRTLQVRGTTARELEAFEQVMAEDGAALARARQGASERLVAELREAFAAITAKQRAVEARYAPGGPCDAALLAQALAENRARDAHRGSAGAGPHRDDLVIELDGHDARVDASQGEHRAVTLGLKMAELSCIAVACGVFPILLLDDVSSELDAARTGLFFAHLRGKPSQIFLTTTRRELIDTAGLPGASRCDFAVSAGTVRLAT